MEIEQELLSAARLTRIRLTRESKGPHSEIDNRDVIEKMKAEQPDLFLRAIEAKPQKFDCENAVCIWIEEELIRKDKS